jgi:hypothetical protein
MPNTRESQLLQRRAALVARSGQLRDALSAQAGSMLPHGMLARSADGALRWAQRHPQWLVGSVVLLLVVRPQRVWRWTGRLLAAWQVARRARPLWSSFVAPRR